ncbi:aromatic alcohol reductase [Pseudomonas syringae]|uniref:aromatic alcohol reductase n=1 Tax=Pseudomonas syringae TaxID=317 RepID=UPI000737A319|nr:aromatic alcohol reductase [Pseudomonas syringae]KTB79230.1 2'-hydroxyisoflavone reductase [Pseudomonas syringae pv. syringae PD2766]
MQADNANVKQRILVLGAGELGLAVLRGLAGKAGEHDLRIAVLLRQSAVNTENAAKHLEIEEIRALDIAIETADLVAASVEELAAVMARYDTVISCVGFAAGRGTQRKLTEAVLKAGVKRYFPWQFGVDYDLIGRGSPQDLFDEQLEVRDMLRAQQHTEWVIVSTGMFTSFLFEPAFGVVDLNAGRVNALGSLNTAVTVTTPEDIGRLTAAIVVHEPRIVNQVVYTAGDTLTYAELADLVERVTGRSIERCEWSVAQLQTELAAMPDDPLRKYRAVFAMGRGVAWDIGHTYNAEHGLSVTSAEHWAQANLAHT